MSHCAVVPFKETLRTLSVFTNSNQLSIFYGLKWEKLVMTASLGLTQSLIGNWAEERTKTKKQSETMSTTIIQKVEMAIQNMHACSEKKHLFQTTNKFDSYHCLVVNYMSVCHFKQVFHRKFSYVLNCLIKTSIVFNHLCVFYLRLWEK